MTPANAMLVVAGVLEDAAGRVLIAKRPEHKHHGGYWEFPGGKLDPGETAATGLARELQEELGIVVESSAQVGVVCEPRPERDLHLIVRRARHWQGQPAALEHSELAWVAPAQLPQWQLAPADCRIAAWLNAPQRLAITPGPEAYSEADWPLFLQRAIERGAQRVHFRAGASSWATHSHLLRHLVGMLQARGVQVALHDLPELAQTLRVDVLHLSERLALSIPNRLALNWSGALGVSIHAQTDPDGVAHLVPDYLLLGQVKETRSHPDRQGMGWTAFADIAEQHRAPVYAIGGLALADLPIAQDHGALGFASISAFF